MATADGSVIASNGGNATTFDAATGVATGQLPSFPQFQSWVGNSYNSGPVEQLFAPGPNAAATFAAFQGGNASANGTAIQQVQTNQPQGVEKQLPDSGPVISNINLIDIHTDKSPDYIFQHYLRTFDGLTRNPNDTPVKNSIQYFTNSPLNAGYSGPDVVNVTDLNQVIDVHLRGFTGLLQRPFSILTERFDATNHVISVVTVKGHPLSGWRYWRVYSGQQSNEVIIETAAYDGPGPGMKNFSGYFIAQGTVSRAWRELLDYLQKQQDLNAAPMGIPVFDLAGQGPVSVVKLRNGLWDMNRTYRDYVLYNVCLASPGAASCF
jgi:hypothetical protein